MTHLVYRRSPDHFEWASSLPPMIFERVTEHPRSVHRRTRPAWTSATRWTAARPAENPRSPRHRRYRRIARRTPAPLALPQGDSDRATQLTRALTRCALPHDPSTQHLYEGTSRFSPDVAVELPPTSGTAGEPLEALEPELVFDETVCYSGRNVARGRHRRGAFP